MNGANNSLKRDTRGPLDDVYPIAVEFNLYYNCFVVLTKMDIRLYDAMSGKMKKVFNDLYDEKMAVDLSNFAFGGRQRKFFISDNAGLIRQYNMKNGVFLKKVNQHNEIENSEFANKLANVKKRDTLDISALIYLQEEKLLISASQDSTVRIYDESDPEESILLKVLCGGH
jgi:WD40 repeat protein